MILESKTSNYKPHPEGVYNAVCVDVIDRGMEEQEFQGQKRMVHKLRIMFETEMLGEDTRPLTVGKTFTASLHPKSTLADFITKWRGRAVTQGEKIDLNHLIGKPCLLVINATAMPDGTSHSTISAISKATKVLAPSGKYDAAAVRQRMNDWKAKVGKPIVPAPQAPSKSPEPALAAKAAETDDIGF